jgi:adenine-specific DNA-methyltransferase
MSRELLQSVIDSFDLQKLKRFFSVKNSKFRPIEESFDYYNNDNLTEGLKLGELSLDDGMLIVCAFKAKQELSERSGKKAQYELGKKILKETQNDAGIFVFYNHEGSFRFSLIYANYLGKRRDWSTFRRFTYFVGKDLTNKTFRQRVGDSDFSSLEKIKDAFSVEKVTKEFYVDIANWFFWAVQHSVFPKDAEEREENGRNIAVIRLITRMIFIWFMRERGLIPKDLFNWKEINNILKDISPEKSTYYLAILQNLFFATLNTKRNFHKDLDLKKEGKPVYGEYYGYHYHDLFKDSSKLRDYFGDIPFLNGGLFECLDDESNGIIIDGFSDNQKNQPLVPNKLFFSAETEADLNVEYGTKNKSYKVRGLINTLSFYNFTIDENELDDQEVALDPELLGRVFENLLASFNPETSTTARKATGSYYTPREIVDYMVTESLKAYFKSHLLNISDMDKKIKLLFSKGSEENPFDKAESKKIVELIEAVKIVDPAVGSGAFPMGALNKMVFILNKVDAGNELWKQAQLRAVETIPDPQVRRNTKNQIEEFFKDKNADYGRKLYLIQKCIYGVDIQQIAVEIAKLRFFISLLVDEKINKGKDNWGIEPLPNLDFKIMQGNSLISEFLGIDFDNGQEKQRNDEQASFILDDGYEDLIKDFEQKKTDYQNESDKNNKARLKYEVENLMIKIFESKIKNQKADFFKELEGIEKKYSALPNKQSRDEITLKEKQKLYQKTGFDLENIEYQLREFTSKKKTRPFFPWKLYFVEVFKNGGFDIVISNPPYIGEKAHKELFRELKKGRLGKYYLGKMDFFYFFFHLALNLGSKNAQVAFISTNYYPTALGARKLRKDFKNRAIILELINFNELKIFEAALGQHNMITILNKGQKEDFLAKTCITKRIGIAKPSILESIVSKIDEDTEYFEVAQKDLYDEDECYIRLSGISNTALPNPMQVLLEKVRRQGKDLISICNINCGIQTGCDEIKINGHKQGVFILSNEEVKFFNNEEKRLIKPFFNTSDIYKYHVNSNNVSWVIYTDRNVNSISEYVNLSNHFNNKEFREVLDNIREVKNGVIKYFQLQWPRKKEIFEGEKIVCPQRSLSNIFGYSNDEWYGGSGIFFITEKDDSIFLKYILALINSKIYYLWLYHRGKRKGEALELIGAPLSKIPIKKISKLEQNPFVEIVDKILEITKSNDYLKIPAKNKVVNDFKNQINQMVYSLYGLSSNEIEMVENSVK